MHDNVCYHVYHHDSDHSTSWGYCPGGCWDPFAILGLGIFYVDTAPAQYYFQIGSPN